MKGELLQSDFFSPFDQGFQKLKRPNFIAFANGSFQVQGINAFILSRQEHGERMCGIVVSYEGRMQDKNEISALSRNEVEFVGEYNQHPIRCHNSWQEWKKEKGKTAEPFYVMFMMKEHMDLRVLKWLRAKYPERPIVVVITTEGLASYVDNAFGQGLFSMREEKGNILCKLAAFLHGTANSLYKGAFAWWLKRQGRLCEFQLLSLLSDGGLRPNRETSQYFRKAFEKSARKREIKIAADHYKNVILFNTQPTFERQECLDADTAVLQKACKMVKDLGLRAVLKPHPAEKNFSRYEKLGYEIDTTANIAQEYLLAAADCKPIAVVGFSSTTLLTANLFWRIPAISLVNCIDLYKIDAHARRAAKKFIIRYKKLQAPKDMQEFAALLKKKMEEGKCYGNHQD